MALRKRIKYQWRLFFPLLGLLCFIIIILVSFQYKREKSYRTDSMMQQLTLIGDRIINTYESGMDLAPFMIFLKQYYENTLVSVTIYDDEGKMGYCVGTPIMQTDVGTGKMTEERRQAQLLGYGTAIRYSPYDPNTLYLYSAKKSNDGLIFVHTAIPYELSIFEAMSSEPSMWFIVFGLTSIVIIIAFYATRYIGRSVSLLRDFADRVANNDKTLISTDKFPSDELGDISRQIIRLYREKDKAIEQHAKEHRIAMHAVEEKSRIKRELTNNINHELKTPIGIIKGYIDTIIDDPTMDKETQRHFIEKTQHHVERLCTLLNDISTITRLDEAGKIPTTDVNFHDLIYAISNDLENTPINGDMAFVFDLPLDCIVKGNNSLLNEAILNLVRNAATYSHGTEMGIKLTAEDDKFYTFTFYDNGVGVDPQYLPHLFERFYRIDAGRSRKVGGTGLGLPIVRNTIITLGGSITVNNLPTGGLQFTFTLPRWKPRQLNTSKPKSI